MLRDVDDAKLRAHRLHDASASHDRCTIAAASPAMPSFDFSLMIFRARAVPRASAEMPSRREHDAPPCEAADSDVFIIPARHKNYAGDNALLDASGRRYAVSSPRRNDGLY